MNNNELPSAKGTNDEIEDLLDSLEYDDARPRDKSWQQCVAERPELLVALESLDTSTKPKIEFLIEQYIAANPHYTYPSSGDRHPAILMIGPAHGWLIDAVGGVANYTRAVFEAGQVWFAIPNASLWGEFNVFNWHFESAALLGYVGDEHYEALCLERLAWARERKTWFPTPPEVLAKNGLLTEKNTPYDPSFRLPISEGGKPGKKVTDVADWD